MQPGAQTGAQGHKTSLLCVPPGWAVAKMAEHLRPCLGKKELADLCIIWAGLFIQKGKLLLNFYAVWYIFHFIHWEFHPSLPLKYTQIHSLVPLPVPPTSALERTSS